MEPKCEKLAGGVDVTRWAFNAQDDAVRLRFRNGQIVLTFEISTLEVDLS